jgi:hypothetical protein
MYIGPPHARLNSCSTHQIISGRCKTRAYHPMGQVLRLLVNFRYAPFNHRVDVAMPQDEETLDTILSAYDEIGIRVVFSIALRDIAALDIAPFASIRLQLWRQLVELDLARLHHQRNTLALPAQARYVAQRVPLHH